MAGRRDPEMQEFWASLPPKLKAPLWSDGRRLVLSSDEVPLHMMHQSRYKTPPKFYLFNDVFAMVQGTVVTEYYLAEIWIEHMVAVEGLLQSLQNVSCFKLVFPESCLELQCKDLAHKSKWVTMVAETVGIALKLPQFVCGRWNMSLDTQLELLRGREYLEYTFHSLPEYKEGRYKGQWKNAKPHGSGEFSQESTGRLYKGGFKDGRFHGEGEMHWFLDKDTMKKYIGEFRNGELEGHGEMKYSSGDVYSGHWHQSQRSGFGRLEETSRKNSFHTGAWENDKKNGYGIYEDKMSHERYLGMWVDDVRCGPGMLVTSTGTYCEATFANGAIAAGHDGFVIDPSGRSFMGRLGPDLKLCGKGTLTLTNGTTIDGSFAGQWHKKIEVQKGILEDVEQREERTNKAQAVMAELQIAKLDKRIGNCTVLACMKWQPIFTECEAALGFSGDAANDVLSAWNKLATDAYQSKSKHNKSSLKARSSSLNRLYGKSVKMPMDLIPLDRARALTLGQKLRSERGSVSETSSPLLVPTALTLVHKSRSEEGSSSETSSPLVVPKMNKSTSLDANNGIFQLSPTTPESENKPKISRPINLEESLYIPRFAVDTHSIYAPHADDFTRPHSNPEDRTDFAQDPFDSKATIQKYVDKSFNNPSHPLGNLMNKLEAVFRESYGGIGANKFLLPHAIAETHSIIQRIHSIVRILFPFLSGDDQNLSQLGLKRVEGYSDPDDYVSIESGYSLLHPLAFLRLFPTLITLYVLHHDETDRTYQKGLDFLKELDDSKLVQSMNFPSHICKKIAGKEADGDILKALDEASNTLRVINSLFTPGEFLDHFKSAFKQLNTIDQLSGDFLLPAVVFILIRANVPHLGAYLHFLADFAHTQPEDEYTLVTYEAAYSFIRNSAPGS